MKTSRILLLFGALLVSGLTFGQSKSILFDGFNNNNNKWSTYKTSTFDRSITGGNYVLDRKSDNGANSTRITINYDPSKDYSILGRFKWLKGSKSGGYGLIFSGSSGGDQNYFLITNNGQYRVSKSKGGSITAIKNWTYSSKIKTGKNAYNTLQVKRVNGRVDFYINSSKVYTHYSPVSYGNKVGFYVSNRQKYWVEYLSIYGQNKGGSSNNYISSNNNKTSSYATKTIMFEGFNNNNNKWPENNNDKVRLKVTGGDYVFNHKRSTGSWYTQKDKYINSTKNFKIIAQIKKQAGVQNYGYGLIFGKKDNKNGYEFLISGNGQFIISKEENDKWTNLKNWTKSSAVKTGNGQYNYLEVRKDGSAYKFYINNQLVHTAYYLKWYGSNVGFSVYNRQEIRVGYLSMSYTGSSTTPKKKNNHTTVETILFDGYTSNVNNWSTSKSSEADFEIKNGNYYINHKRSTAGYTSTITKYIDTSRDFKILADFKKESGIQNHGYGLVFGRKDSNNQNLFYVSGDGSYQINRMKNGKSNYRVKWASSSAIRKGNGAYNVLKVVKVGSQLEYYINNTKVYTDSTMEFFGDRLGYIVYHKQKVSVAYLSVGYLDKKKTTPTVVTNFSTDNVPKKYYSDSSYDFSEQFNNNNNYWPTTNDKTVHYKVSNGKYRMLRKTKNYSNTPYITKFINTSKDFELEIKIDKISGALNEPYGLAFGGKGNSNLQFLLASSGYYKVSRQVKGKFEDIIKWTKNANVQYGNQKSNTLKVKKEGDYYKFYVNDKYVNEIDFEPFYGNELGIFFQKNQELAIDFIRYKYVQKSNITIAETKLTAPVYENFSGNKNNWHLENIDDYTANIEYGKLVIDRKQSGGISVVKDLNLNTSKNFVIKTSLTPNKSGATGMYGVTFGRKNASNNFSFLLSPNGKYTFRKLENNNFKSIIPATYSSAIKTGMNENNDIKIIKTGNKLRFYVNNQYLNEASYQSFMGSKIGFTVFYSQRVQVDYLDVNYNTESFNEPPVIVITEPNVELKRGFKIVKTKKIKVKGKATDKDGIYEVKINGTDAYISQDGTFTADVPLGIGNNELVVEARDTKQAASTKTFVIKRQSPVKPDDPPVVVINNNDKNLFGNYYALMIAVSDYDDEDISDLAGAPINDATKLSDVLITKYGFKSENVTMLTNNPKKLDIMKAFYELKRKVTKKDNVIIFYAGHGSYDEKDNVGWWMPSDYVPAFRGNKITNHEIIKEIETIPSRHTLLISDACFSGGVFKNNRSGAKVTKSITKKLELQSRRAITSGNLKEVPNESYFLEILLKRLNENNQPYLAASRLFYSLQDAVMNNTENTPLYGPIFGAKDEGGDFIFVKN